MNDVEKDQLVDQGSNDILGGISDEKDQMIDSIAEAILNRILDDERIKALTFSKEFDKDSRKNKDHMMCAEIAGDFHLGDSRQPTYKNSLPFDSVS